jgi:ATP:corrinoid adenosyltransferase
MSMDISIHERQWAANQNGSAHRSEITGLMVVFAGNGKGKSKATECAYRPCGSLHAV